MAFRRRGGFRKRRRFGGGRVRPKVRARRNLLNIRMRPYGRSRLARAVTQIQHRLHAEPKFVDLSLAATVKADAKNYSQLLSDVDQGTGSNQRTGMAVKWKNANITWTMTKDADAKATACRVVLLVDKKPVSGAVATYADVYGATGTYLSHIDKLAGAGDRFVILKSRIIIVDTTHPVKTGHFFVGLKDIVSEYDDATGNDGVKNDILIVAMSNDSVDPPTLATDTRMTYFDN